jgi:3-oxoadipate enol-lactonase
MYSAIHEIGSGPAIVFLHGYPLNRSLWQRQVEELSSSYRLILVDLAGYGSAKPIDRGNFANMADFADDVARSLESVIDEPFVLVGLSMGGYIALEFWSEYASRLKGLVLTNTKATADTKEAVEVRQKNAQLALDNGTSEVVEPMIEKLLSQASRNDKSTLDWLKETMYLVSPETVAASLLAMSMRRDFSDLLPKIDIPTYVISGTEDALSPPEVMKPMADAIPNAQFHVIEGSGHLSPMETPAEFNSILRSFMNSLPQS